MSRQATILFLCAILLHWQPWGVLSTSLVPPKGFSLGFTGNIARGMQKYTCNNRAWTKTGSSADIYAPGGAQLGTYWSVKDALRSCKTVYWNIINSAGAYSESGQSISGLQGAPYTSETVSTSGVAEYLALIDIHRGAGDASQVAFVSLTQTKNGYPPHKSLCTVNGATTSVPFSGTFSFYNQDTSPTSLPPTLTPKGTFVQAVFAKGHVSYQASGDKWLYSSIFLTLYDVAGGNVVGKFGTNIKADKRGSRLSWRFNDPNGFWFSGQPASRSVKVSEDGVSWQLMVVTSYGGTQPPLGMYKNVVLGGTLGGLSPIIAGGNEGLKYNSPMVGMFYCFT